MRKSLSIVLALRPMAVAISRWVRSAMPMLAENRQCARRKLRELGLDHCQLTPAIQSRSGPGSFAGELGRRSPSPDHSTSRRCLLRLRSPEVDHQVGRGAEQIAARRSDRPLQTAAATFSQSSCSRSSAALAGAMRAKISQELLAIFLEDLLQTIVNTLPGLRASIAACRQAQIDERLSWGLRA